MSRFNKPLPGTPFNYAHPLYPARGDISGAAGGLILPLNEGSGRPRMYLPQQQYSVASNATDRLATLTGTKWNPYPTAMQGRSKFGGPTLSLLSTTDIINLGITSDFMPYTATTIVVGYHKRSAADDWMFNVSTGTLSQAAMARILGSTGQARWYFGGNTNGTDALFSGTGLTLGDDVWVFSTGDRGMEIWQNGSLIASQTSHATRTNNTQPLYLGADAFWGSSDLSDFAFFYVYPLQLTKDQISWISNDPFCFYDWGEDILLITTITPDTAALTLTTYAPTVLTPFIPFTANLVLTTYAPTVTITAPAPVITGSLLQIDWNDDGDFNDTGEDVTARLISTQPLTCVRGKDQLRLLAPPMAGAFNCELDNRSRDYSVENSGSPIFANLHPGHKLRATLTASSVNYTIFTGILDDLPQHPEFGRWSVEAPALGSLSRLRGKRVSTVLLENVTTDEAMEAVLDAAGWPPLERTLQVGLTTLDFYWTDNEDAFDAIATLLLTEGPGASVYENPNGYFIFENRHSRITQVRSTTSQFTFTDQDYILHSVYDSGIKDVINQVEVGVTVRTVKEESVIWYYGKPLILGPNETRVVRAVASDPFKDAQTPDPNSGVNAVQLISLLGTNPQIRLSFRDEQTVDIGSTSQVITPALVQAALEGLTAFVPGDVVVTYQTNAPDVLKLNVEFQGNYAHMPIELLGLSAISLSNKPLEAKITDKVVGVVDDYDLLAGSLVSLTLSASSGQSVELTFVADTGGAYIDQLQMRARLASTDSTKRLLNTLDATASIAAYGLRPYNPSSRQEITEEQAIQLADNIIRYYQDPRPTIVFDVAGTDGTIQLQQLTRGISDRIRITDAQTGVDEDYFIERIAHRITEGPHIFTEFGCERVLTGTIGGPGGGGGDVAIVGSAIVGTSTVGA